MQVRHYLRLLIIMLSITSLSANTLFAVDNISASLEKNKDDVKIPITSAIKGKIDIPLEDEVDTHINEDSQYRSYGSFVKQYIHLQHDITKDGLSTDTQSLVDEGLKFTESKSNIMMLKPDDENINTSVYETNADIPATDFMKYSNGTKVPLFYKELSSTLLNKFDVLSALTPDNYRDMVTPMDSSSPYSRYSNTFYGDDSSNINIGLKTSNLVLDTIFDELTGKTLTLNLAQSDLNSQDIDSMKIQARPLNWLKLKLIVDLKATNPMLSNNLELEINPTSNTALILRNKDNSTETETGIEFRLDF